MLRRGASHIDAMVLPKRIYLFVTLQKKSYLHRISVFFMDHFIGKN